MLTLTTAAVADVYAAWGLEHTEELADYLPVELQFVGYLTELAAYATLRHDVGDVRGDDMRVDDADAPGETEAALRRFAADHLLVWLPAFAADLQQHARLPFYQEVGRQLAEFASLLASG